MLTDIIIDTLASAESSLIKGSNLFAEKASGDQYVVVTTTAERDLADGIPGVRHATVQVAVKGWGMVGSHAMAVRMVEAINGMAGNYVHGSDTYHITGIVVRNHPIYAGHYGGLTADVFTANLDVYFKLNV